MGFTRVSVSPGTRSRPRNYTGTGDQSVVRPVFAPRRKKHASVGVEDKCRSGFTAGAKCVPNRPRSVRDALASARRLRPFLTGERESAAAPLYISWEHEDRGTPRVFHDVSTTDAYPVDDCRRDRCQFHLENKPTEYPVPGTIVDAAQ